MEGEKRDGVVAGGGGGVAGAVLSIFYVLILFECNMCFLSSVARLTGTAIDGLNISFS